MFSTKNHLSGWFFAYIDISQKKDRVQKTFKKMKDLTLLVSPRFSLDGILLDDETKKIQKDIEQALKRYKNLDETMLSFGDFPYLLNDRLTPMDNGSKRSLPFEKVVQEIEKEGTHPLSFPYLLGLFFSNSSQFLRLFNTGIQSIELLDKDLQFFRFRREKSFCIKMRKGTLVLCVSEYIADGLVNASGRISPKTITFPCSPVEKESFEKELSEEKRIRLTTGLIGGNTV